MGRKVKYGVPQEGELTAKQWREKGYIPKSTAKGVERWFGLGTHQCYTSKEVRFIGIEAAAEKYREKRRADARKNRAKRKAAAAELAEFLSYHCDCHTAYQWLTDFGRIPLPSANWRSGERRAGQSENYLYCHINDTRAPESDAELERIKDAEAEAYSKNPEGYNGRMMSYPEEPKSASDLILLSLK